MRLEAMETQHLNRMEGHLESARLGAEKYGEHAPFVRDLLLQGLLIQDGTPPDWRYGSYQHLVADLSPGVKVASPKLPAGYEPMTIRECFRNAWNLVLEDPDLLYCEGFAQAHLFPTAHAWVETRDGQVIDPTWANFEDLERVTYFGVRFDGEVAAILSLESGWASVFSGDEALRHRALKNGFEMHDGIVVGTIDSYTEES